MTQSGLLLLRKISPQQAALALLCLVYLLLQLNQAGGPYDDAYITFRYARRISQGLGFTYNDARPVLGTTTPLYTLLMAAVARLFSPDALPAAARLLSITADLASAGLLYRLVRHLFGSGWAGVLAAGVYLFQPFRANTATGGMETSLLVALLLWAYYDYYVGDRRLQTALPSALAFLTRPDAALALLPLYAAWFFADRRRAAQAGLVAAALAAPWLLWATAYFGSPLPHTILAKSLAYKQPSAHAAMFLLLFFASGTINVSLPPAWLPLLALLALFLLLVGLWSLARSRPAVLGIAAYPLLYAAAMSAANPPLWFPWYYLPLVPGLIVVYFAAAWLAPLPCVKWARTAATLLLAIGLVAVPLLVNRLSPSWDPGRQRERALSAACEQFQARVRPGEWVLAPDIGVAGWCLEQANILDPIGLVFPEALPYVQDLPPGQWVSPELVQDFRPEYIFGLDFFFDPYLVEDEGFREEYELLVREAFEVRGEVQVVEVYRRRE